MIHWEVVTTIYRAFSEWSPWYFSQRVLTDELSITLRLTSRSKHGRSSIATQSLTFSFIILTIALTVTSRTQNGWLYFIIFWWDSNIGRIKDFVSLPRANLEFRWNCTDPWFVFCDFLRIVVRISPSVYLSWSYWNSAVDEVRELRPPFSQRRQNDGNTKSEGGS